MTTTARQSLTVGELLDIVSRARSVIECSDGADEHAELRGDLESVEALIRGEVDASHMGTGVDVVLLERGDA